MADHIKSKHVLFCNCGGERIHPDLISVVKEHLRKLPVDVIVLSDLCGLVAKRRDFAADVFRADTEYLVLGCFPRTMNLLFDQLRVQNSLKNSFRQINLIGIEPADAIDKINEFCGGYESPGDYREINEDTGWPSWYPVIDYARCTTCGQCSDFCLFGVYEKTEDRIKVVNPEGCKINCPACARICPSTAIIFPKYKHGGAIGGSDEIDEQAEHRRQLQDMDSILGNDLYQALEFRKAKRQSIIREEAMNRAIVERDNALNDSKP